MVSDCGAEMWIFDEMRNKMAAHVKECTIESPKFDKRGPLITKLD